MSAEVIDFPTPATLLVCSACENDTFALLRIDGRLHSACLECKGVAELKNKPAEANTNKEPAND